MKISQFNEEVYYTTENITKVDRADIAFLKNKAALNLRKRVRLCSHPDVQDPLHEMLIIHAKGAYIRPHKHVGKSESFHIIEGRLNVVVFEESGDIKEVIAMGDYASGCQFYYRLSDEFYHSVIPVSEVAVFHEVTNGPFKRQDMIFSPWSPEEDDLEGQKRYLNELKLKTKAKVSHAKRNSPN